MGEKKSVKFTSSDGTYKDLLIAIITVITEGKRFRVSTVGNRSIGMLSVSSDGTASFQVVGQGTYEIRTSDNAAAAVVEEDGEKRLYPYLIKGSALGRGDLVMQAISQSLFEYGKITYEGRSGPTPLGYAFEMAAFVLYATTSE